MKKRLLSAFLVLAMVLTLLPSAALAEPNDTEFHINGIQAMKDLVAAKLGIGEDEKITIHSVEVHGAKKNDPNKGDPAVATGGTISVNHGYWHQGDVGAAGTNGKLTGYDDIWMVLNDAAVIEDDSVTAITIYAKTDTGWLGYGGEELAPVTVYLDDEDIKTENYEGKLIRAIYVKGGSLTPPPATTYSYIVNYYWVDEEGTVTKSDTVDSVTADAVSQKQITYKDPENVRGYDSSNAYVLDPKKSSADFIWDTDKQIFDVYYAVDANKNGTPDYEEQTVVVNFVAEGNEKVGTDEMTVDASATEIALNDIALPTEPKFLRLTDGQPESLIIKDDQITVFVERYVGVNYHLTDTDEYKEGEVNVAIDATEVNTSTLTDIPSGYELVTTGNVGIYDGWISVDVKPVATVQTVVVNFVAEGNEKVGTDEMTVDASATEIALNDIELPTNPKFLRLMDGNPENLTIKDGQVTVFVERYVGVNYWDIENNCQVKESSVVVDADATHVNSSALTDIPEGYELVWVGDFKIMDGWIFVELRLKDSGMKTVGVNYWDVVNNEQVAEGSVIVDADATMVNTTTLTDVPAGYELVWLGDVQINDGWIYVEVRPAEDSKIVGLNYWDIVNNKQVAEGSVVVDADATIVNTSTFTDIPKGYELVWTGDLPIVDGWVWVEVRPVEDTKTVGLNYWDIVNDKQVAEGSLTVDADATLVNTSTFTDIPKGYELVWTGDLPIVDGWVWVEVRPVEDTPVEKLLLTYDANYGSNPETKVIGYEAGETAIIKGDLFGRKNYTFTGWNTDPDGDGKSYDRGDKLEMDEDITLYAQWKRVDNDDDNDRPSTGTRYTIDASASRGGDISPEGRVFVARGNDRTFRITADEGYVIDDVRVDGESVGAVRTYTFENVRRDHTIEVIFVPDGQQTVVYGPDDTGVSDWLNVDDHVSYLNGYPGGLFGPNDNMTRAEVAQMFYNLLLNQNVTVTVSFADVSADAWYAQAVNALASLGIVQGVGDGMFAPERTITRAEFTVIAMRFAELPTGGTNPFSDVRTSDWFYAQVVGAAQYGWITGYTNGTFGPNNTITRAEVTAIVNRMLSRSADEDFVDDNAAELVRFNDVSDTYWAYYDIMEATNSHEYEWDNNAEEWTDLA